MVFFDDFLYFLKIKKKFPSNSPKLSCGFKEFASNVKSVNSGELKAPWGFCFSVIPFKVAAS